MTELCNNESLSVNSLTTGETTGRGVFDELMRATKSHLLVEHSAGRITGDSYTEAYIASISNAMAQGNQFILNYLLTNQQVKLLDWQIKEAEQKYLLTQVQVENMEKQNELLDQQILSAQKDILLKDEQIDQLNEQTKLIVQQLATEVVNTTLVSNNASRVISEKAVLDQKLITEKAQVNDSIDGTEVAGVIGKQMQLYENQAEGYIRDAEQKAAKIFMDSFNTRTSIETTEAAEPTDATVTGTQIKGVLNRVREGVGVSTE